MRLAFCLVGAVSLVGLGWSARAQAQLFTPPATTEYELMNGADSPQVTVRITPLPGADGLDAEIVRVVAGDQARPPASPGFTVRYDKDAKRLYLDTQTKPPVFLAPATYKVSVEVTGTAPSAAQGRTTQTLDLQLVLRPAKLQAIPAIKMTHDRWPYGGGPPRKITLTEETGVTSVTRLKIRQLEPATNGDWQVPAGFDMGKLPPSLVAGTSQDINLEGHDFPLGVTRGQLVVEGDQLAQPITIPFEVKTRLYSWFIIVIFLICGVLGWYVRHHLKQAEARVGIEAQLAPILQRAKDEIAANSDETQKTAIKQAQKDVAAALKLDDTTVLSAKVEALRVAVETAAATRVQLVNDLLKAVGLLKAALGTPWELPVGASDDLAKALQEVAGAEADLGNQDAKAAKDVLGNARKKIDLAGDALNVWAKEARPHVKALGTPTAAMPLPASARQPAADAASSATAKLAALSDWDKTKNLEPSALAIALEPFLRAAHEARMELHKLNDAIAPVFALEGKGAIDALKQKGKSDDELKALSAALQVDLTGDPKDAAGRLAAGITAFATALKPLLKGAEATALMESGDYMEAVKKSVGGDGPEISAIGDRVRQGVAGLRRFVPPDLRRAASDVFLIPPPSPLDPVVLAQARLAALRAWRGVVVASIMAVAAWAVYQDSWIGTWSDIIGVGVVAFFTDFTIDALVDAVGKLRKA